MIDFIDYKILTTTHNESGSVDVLSSSFEFVSNSSPSASFTSSTASLTNSPSISWYASLSTWLSSCSGMTGSSFSSYSGSSISSTLSVGTNPRGLILTTADHSSLLLFVDGYGRKQTWSAWEERMNGSYFGYSRVGFISIPPHRVLRMPCGLVSYHLHLKSIVFNPTIPGYWTSKIWCKIP